MSKKPKPATPDALVKTTQKGEITLTEEDLSRVSGGGEPAVEAAYHTARNVKL
jgi:hypothetical protein